MNFTVKVLVGSGCQLSILKNHKAHSLHILKISPVKFSSLRKFSNLITAQGIGSNSPMCVPRGGGRQCVCLSINPDSNFLKTCGDKYSKHHDIPEKRSFCLPEIERHHYSSTFQNLLRSFSRSVICEKFCCFFSTL